MHCEEFALILNLNNFNGAATTYKKLKNLCKTVKRELNTQQK